jgi:hypothetical protein
VKVLINGASEAPPHSTFFLTVRVPVEAKKWTRAQWVEKAHQSLTAAGKGDLLPVAIYSVTVTVEPEPKVEPPPPDPAKYSYMRRHYPPDDDSEG